MSTALTGFDTSQQTLSAHMNSLQGSLDKTKEITDEQLKEARGDLSKEIVGLAQTMKEFNTTLSMRLEENSSQLASLNGNLSGVDQRLTESISRQRAFETLVLQRIVFQGPLDSNVASPRLLEKWTDAGYKGFLIAGPADSMATIEAQSLNEWETLFSENSPAKK
jgi:hypothetical protein